VLPFSLTAQFLRVLWDGIPLLIWGWFTWEAYRRIGGYLGTPPELTAPIALIILGAVMWLLRPVRKFFNMNAYVLMVLSPIKPLIELGVWKLLLVHDQYFRTEHPLYEGTLAFTNAYHRRSPKGQAEINAILWKAELLGKSHLAK